MASGDFDFEIRLRKTDAFQHIAQKLNTLIHNVRNGIIKPQKIVTIKKSISKQPSSKAVKKTTSKKAVKKKTAKKTTKKKTAKKR